MTSPDDPVRVRRAFSMILLSMILTLAAVAMNAAYTKHLQQQADRRWCSLLTSLDQPQAPATTERGLIIQRQIHTLRVQLECRP